MIADVPLTSGWTPQRWVLALSIAFLFQVAVVFLISDNDRLSRPSAPSKTRVHLVSAEALSHRRAVFEPLDPTLFSLVTSRGFSRRAWLTLGRFDYDVTNVLAPPRWLPAPVEELVDDYDSFVQTNLYAEENISAKLDPELSAVHVPTPILKVESKLNVLGELAEVPLRSGIPVPQAAEATTNSVVRVRVDSEGRVLSAALVAGCGVASADQQALRFAKQAHFEFGTGTKAPPQLVGRLGKITFCDIVFQWRQFKWNNPSPLGAQP